MLTPQCNMISGILMYYVLWLHVLLVGHLFNIFILVYSFADYLLQKQFLRCKSI